MFRNLGFTAAQIKAAQEKAKKDAAEKKAKEDAEKKAMQDAAAAKLAKEKKEKKEKDEKLKSDPVYQRELRAKIEAEEREERKQEQETQKRNREKAQALCKDPSYNTCLRDIQVALQAGNQANVILALEKFGAFLKQQFPQPRPDEAICQVLSYEERKLGQQYYILVGGYMDAATTLRHAAAAYDDEADHKALTAEAEKLQLLNRVSQAFFGGGYLSHREVTSAQSDIAQKEAKIAKFQEIIKFEDRIEHIRVGAVGLGPMIQKISEEMKNRATRTRDSKSDERMQLIQNVILEVLRNNPYDRKSRLDSCNIMKYRKNFFISNDNCNLNLFF